MAPLVPGSWTTRHLLPPVVLSEPMEVVVEDPEDMNLLGLFLKAALDERREAVSSAGLEGDIAVTASGMSVTLSFSPDRLVVTNGVRGKPRAHLKGSLESLVAIARGHLWRTLLTGKARVTGNPMAAMPLARVFKQRPSVPERVG